MTTPGHMRAARLGEAREMETGELPLLEPQPGEVRVRVEACGICGTDLHTLHGGLMPIGHTPGHEVAGRIDALGADVKGLSEGDSVAIEPLVSCGTCVDCRAGRDSICRKVMLRGVHLPGGMAEQLVVSADRAIPLADGISPAVAALTEPMAVAVHGLDRGALTRGERVLVLGAGAVGLVSLVAAQSLGAGEVWITARYPHQAELAKNLGATRVLREDEADPMSLDALSREVDFDLIVESVGGQANTLLAAASAARPGARIAVLGLFVTSPELAPLSLLLKELTLAWSNCYHRPTGERSDFTRAAEIVDRERERLSMLITHELPLEEVGKAFAIAANKSSGSVKVSVRPSP
jgi:2-desacetyl-2-hydroxyethyl bacteriochlorophyllide A dehydrogenase